MSRSFSESCWQRIAAPNEPSPTCLSEKSCILKPKRRLSQSLLQKILICLTSFWYLISDILSMKSDEPFWESCSGACLEFTRLWCQNEACRCWTLRRFPKAFWHVNRAMPATPIYSAIRVLKAVWIRACAMALSNLRNWSVWRVAHFSESLICRWDPSDKESPGSVSRKT